MLYGVLALFGGLAGVTTVLFGFGGGFVVVPLLYWTLSGSPDPVISAAAMQIAVATSTCVMIVNALIATGKHRRAGNLRRAYIWPLAGFIGLGSVLGAVLASGVSSGALRWAFIAYLALTIVDCLARRGFMQQGATGLAQPLKPVVTVGGGLLIGAVATFLGVGGSVMTVPLLRRSGLSMSLATAMANPLSVPVAVVGTLTYVLMAGVRQIELGAWYAGYVDLRAFALLILGSLLGIRLATPLIGRIPDRLHARVYIVLLMCVLLAMVLK
ncbi:sulfite exporter TauE/SafE family protein [Pseudomonas gingeri]|uniref:sulfite exporter TauE/SafE family protein n=1 Tax=Pseudomonas gingeri TaxID=117681 RepID=UPI0015A3A888|nr:sulfite exporter TauE/SafE family protein [Pseudomonas gingeri]NWA26003.1 sulfite exporter TauE/SafE family protein [Pseudomonas gingeri]NWD67518.1 sulfite exporter TauE/SafE family protein [Pseudomonas gingeri]NWD74333.1 sulfite exporter TauE/SafE family protein [Pseudomonas gingeri]